MDVQKLETKRLACGAIVPKNMGRWSQRAEYCHKYSWATPSVKALQALVKLSPLVEIAAGNGYWAHLLTKMGADIVAYDRCPPKKEGHKNRYFDDEVRLYHPVQKGGYKSVTKHSDRTLFLCWPPCCPMAFQTLYRYDGECVAYIGERKGCTADYRFERQLAREWDLAEKVKTPRWSGVDDALYIFRRKTLP